MGYVEMLIYDLRRKAAQSERRHSSHGQHVCRRAAEFIAAVSKEPGNVPFGAVRQIFSQRLGLHNNQRSYSWHEIQDALEEISKLAAKAD